jgi:hypothetical protein
MDSSIAAAAIGAGAALLGSALAGSTTYLATKKTLAHSSSQLTAKLSNERDAAREEREQERLKEAYVTLLKYVFWLQDVNSIRKRVVTRQYAAIAALKPDRGPQRTVQDAASLKDAFLGAGASEQEQRRLEAGPTYQDNAATWALVKAVSSDAVLAAFEALMERDDAYSSRQVDVERALLHEPESTTVTEAARQRLKATGTLLTATWKMIDAGEVFDTAADTLTSLAREELKQARTI